MYELRYLNELYHHGIKGQKWGIRRYQNPDGSLTPEGKRRYGTVENLKRSKEYRAAVSAEGRKYGAVRNKNINFITGNAKVSKAAKDPNAIKKLVTGNILAGAIGGTAISSISSSLSKKSSSLGSKAAASILSTGFAAYTVASSINTVKNSIAIGRKQEEMKRKGERNW